MQAIFIFHGLITRVTFTSLQCTYMLSEVLSSYLYLQQRTK